MANKTNVISSTTMRQKITAVLVGVVVIVVGWQIYGLFGGDSSTMSAPSNAATSAANPAPAPSAPQAAAALPKPKTLSPIEIALQQQQQETQAKYVAALNELQMLKIERDIAENELGIMKAKQETVTAQKSIVDLLAPRQQAVGSYAQNLVTPSSTASNTTAETSDQTAGLSATEIKYTVISVSLIQSKWSAVLGLQGNLYSVAIGDVLPADGSKVVSISKSGVVLEKDGVKKVISLVPVI